MRIEGWDPLQHGPQAEFVKGGTGGVLVEQYIDDHANADNAEHKFAAAEAKKALAAARLQAPARLAMEREHAIQTRELTGCWINLCAMGIALPCSVYCISREGDNVLSFSACVCCLGVCAFPASGQYRRDNHYDELVYQRMDEGLSASRFVIKSRRHMKTDVGGLVYKLC